MSSELVLVTGASGFLALHVVKQCLKHGYKVRGTVRNLKDENKLKPLRKLYPQANLELVEADLLNKDSWKKAMKGVMAVLHVASPFPNRQPKNEDEVIKPAVEGTLNVMNAAFQAKVKRLVFTSSTATLVGYEREKDFTEDDWPEMEKVTKPYVKSKVLAEKSTFSFVKEKKDNDQECFELVVLNPSFIIGPTLHETVDFFGTSESLIYRVLNGEMEKIPFFSFGACDVRDVALAHVRAISSSNVVGHRHPLLTQREWVSMKYVGEILYEEFYKQGYKVPLETESGSPNKSTMDNSRWLKDLKINPIHIRQSLIDMCNRFIELGLVSRREK